MVAEPLQGDEERACHLRRAGAHGVQRPAVHLTQYGVEQAAGADVEKIHFADDLHGLRRDGQLLPSLSQGALHRRLAVFGLAAGKTDLAGLAHRSGAYLIQQGGAVRRVHQRNQHGGAAPGAHQGGDMIGVGPAQGGKIHGLYVLSGKIPPPCGGGSVYRPMVGQQPQPQPLLLLFPQPQPPLQPLPQNRNSRMMAMMIQQQLPPPKQEF